ncbi:hypothetical protein BDV19DRAFT_366150 [Aspergillus venezuelensis]
MGQLWSTLFGSQPPALCLAHPTDDENKKIWALTSNAWKDALSVDVYLEESAYLMTVPLAKDGGMTQWILVDKNLPPNERPILASCESFYKRSWISDPNGNVTEALTHGVASVYVDEKLRGKGYATRLMKELAKTLPSWQTERTPCAASVLFSDIGKDFYSSVGWHAFPSYNVEFSPQSAPVGGQLAKPLFAEDLPQLCEPDKALSRNRMERPSSEGKTRFMIIPDLEHMLWHHSKEEFAGMKLFGKKPDVKGAIYGEPGERIWVIWTHRFYEPPSPTASSNTLYILRLVLESQGNLLSASQLEGLNAVIAAARNEAATWGLHTVKLWDPSPAVMSLIEILGIEHRFEDREEEGICSLRWYGSGSGKPDEIEWVANEKYGWC